MCTWDHSLKTNRLSQNTMLITFIGAGNLATNLCKAAKDAGHNIRQIYSRTEESAATLAHIVGAPYTIDLTTINMESDIYIVSVKDDVLQNVANRLRERVGERLIVHTAGSMPMDVIPSSRRGVFYPMQTFSRKKTVSFREIPCFLEASNPMDLAFLHEFAASVSSNIHDMSSNDRRYLHLAAVFCCNFANHCYAIGAELLRAHGNIPFEVMLPLISETAGKLRQLSPEQAQTGPAVRWDTNVIDKHISLLSETRQWQDIYRLLSQSIHDMSSSEDKDATFIEHPFIYPKCDDASNCNSSNK